MASLGFKPEDFTVFGIEGFSNRMGAIYSRLRPKLIGIGASLAPQLSRKLNMEFFPHVANHARTTVTPPESWCAWGPSPKGYRRYAYLALCVSAHGLHARAVVKADARHRAAMARAIESRGGELTTAFKGTKVSLYHPWDFAAMPTPSPATQPLWDGLAASLAKSSGALDLGFGWPPGAALRLDSFELLDAYRELEPLYRILRSAVT